MTILNCDAKTGVCSLPESAEQSASNPQAKTAAPIAAATVRYIGDPMCSWCWAIAPVLEELLAYCERHGLNFSVHVGGLRPGGGDAWNPAFKAFLRQEWQTIHRVSGQPFGFSILETADFNYDTEPACRAVVTMKLLQASRSTVLAFFSGIQRQFYVDGADPKAAEFYRALCAEADVSYETFLKVFLSDEAKDATLQEFQRCRRWGVRGFPSIILDVNGSVTQLASGYTTSAELITRLESALSDASKTS